MADAKLKAVDKVEIITLQDNYIDITAMDGNAVIERAPFQLNSSIIAEHGFSAVVKATSGNETKTLLFDFGFSADGAARNASILNVDMGQVEVAALSHGHSDHTGGLEKLAAMIGKENIPFAVHPAVFKKPRYLKKGEDSRINFPEFTRERVAKAGLKIAESKEPRLLMDNNCLFLGEVPKKSDFENGLPNACFLENGNEKHDIIEDDTSIVMNLKEKGLIILSGCAHSGIVNTILYAREVTGIEKVHAVMGGFHLSGPLFEPIIKRTTDELKKFSPRYVIPAHCTGRKAVLHIEKEMPEQFILNMSGTKLTFV